MAVNAEGDWQQRLQVLHPEDIRGPGREDFDNRQANVSERRRERSWIWLVPCTETLEVGIMEEHLDADLRVEWAKSRARSARWAEEVDLILEEMHRTLLFFKWKARWWRGLVGLQENASGEVCQGVDAYSLKQADLLEQRVKSYAKDWLLVLRKRGVHPEWEAEYMEDEIVIEEIIGDEEDIYENQSEVEDEVGSDGNDDDVSDDYEVDV